MTQLDFEDFDKYLLDQKGRIIHQVWFDTVTSKKEAKKAYAKLKMYRDSWSIKNPTWCRVEWNKAMCIQLVKSFYPEHADLFKTFKYEIQKCDSVRYLFLHRYGGWYADMDYFCNKSLDEAMNQFTNDIYFVQSPNRVSFQDDDHISNSLMYSVPNHSFWKQIMLEIELNKNKYHYGKHLTVMFTTGPGMLNRIYAKYKYKYKVKSLPYKLFHPYGITDIKLSLSDNKDVFAVHLGKGSWEDKDSKFLIFWLKEWKILLFIIVILLLPLIFSFIKKKNN